MGSTLSLVTSRAGPISESYWVEPGKLCAGEYPYALDPGEGSTKLAAIRAAGINTFVDLTEEGEYGLRSYREEVGDLEHVRFAIRDEDVPSTDAMRSTLDAIDEAIARGRTVYLHCWGGHGRTGTVAGCYLVRHGHSPAKALASIADWRRGLPDSDRLSPATAEQRRFVEGWAE